MVHFKVQSQHNGESEKNHEILQYGPPISRQDSNRTPHKCTALLKGDKVSPLADS
jgi:hypothetical protein